MSPIDRGKTARLASNEGVKEAQVHDRLLHEIYVNLYHLEELFTKQGLQVTIAAKEMRLPDELLVEIRKANPGMLILIGRVEPHTLESLYGAVQVPMLMLPYED